MTPFLLLFVALATASPMRSIYRAHHELDADGDGLVSLQEATQGIHMNQALHALDSDGDQMFTEAQALQFLDHHFFAQFDANHDHMLSFDELSGLTVGQMFDFYDHNDDGFLEGAEAQRLQYIWDAIHGHGNNRRQAADIDADGDGLISRPEVHAVMTLQNALDALDTDDDHGFTEQETTDFFGDESLYQQWNTNGDDHLSFGEVHHGITLDGVFDWFDTNGDGFLEGPEADKIVFVYNAMVAAGIHHGNNFRNHHELDANGDGQVSLQEATQAINVDQALHAMDSDGDGMFTEAQALQFLDHHFFAQFDTNHDHMLSIDELRGLTVGDMFRFYDHNHDGFLVGTEADQFYYMWNAVHGHGNNFRNHHELDANADGQVSLTEVTQAMNIDQVIVVLDTDGDMMFTEAEALMFMSHSTFAHLDTDHDHSLTFDEIRLGLTLGQMFNFLDNDGDGFLMGAEADQFQTIWTALNPEPPRPVLDANNDAHLSKPEVLAAMTLDEILVALDTNGDQQFTVDDALQFLDHHYINVLDTNHDHVLSFDEIRAGMTLGDLFDFYDENGDGFLYGSEADKITYMFNEVQNGGTVPIPV
ncbi:Hypp7530 [Branchiostoma lanceolatum]|uniref:Hypp7530 protein n=1 Tax=Branchiostoma lanceolatum TaxID=7740 RepID=A0A8J9Z212_BRALA|nr:Hypp7530 [Branchiostoma lanceolatum]